VRCVVRVSMRPPKAEIITLTSVSLASSVASSREGGISPSRETPRQLFLDGGQEEGQVSGRDRMPLLLRQDVLLCGA
jgi:hypothetical protein